ncbi:phosphatidate cytidylyltransferase [Nonomuraea muscovyensis]|uniref:Phosphatidate cytidylyltransferase n=1 Tax=Nonomuraea muscovyensis TaxID=1124761 RepID=A0A7X0CCX4_9ACTN|nr:phosphatidate cytidylyltransferase [Nonomuraea muscovyensis]MBB6351841.1 phosphatidate cytidylyltransferase [Nonomuraea muscovyensis]MDF2711927.1 phosphatidate cytidylyltransferase [Nonomuraea muscovyensis]
MEERTAGSSPSGGSRTGRNLPAAIAVGVGLGTLVIASLYTIKELFLLVVVAAVGVGTVELVRAFATRGIRVPVVPVLAALAAMQAGAYWGGPVWLLGTFVVFTFVLLIWRMFSDGTDGYVRDATASVFLLAYPPLLAGFVALLLAPPDGKSRVVVFIAVTVASDIGGYIAGVLFGRHKMSVISPKKTWEGFAGSVIACMAVGAWLVVWLFDGAIWQGALIGVLAAMLATAGDLIESMIKRDLGIKDLGSILPGHGGLMDRLDSLVTTLVPVWLLLSWFF